MNLIEIDNYISAFPDGVRERLEIIRKIIRAEAPDVEEAMRYGIPTFRLKNINLVHFAAFKHHLGFYPTPAVIEAFRKELGDYKTSKGAIQLPLNQPLPVKLIEQMVAYRVRQVVG